MSIDDHHIAVHIAARFLRYMITIYIFVVFLGVLVTSDLKMTEVIKCKTVYFIRFAMV